MSDTYTVDGPSPSEIERAEDLIYQEDFARLVGKMQNFVDAWGAAAAARVLARALAEREAQR